MEFYFCQSKNNNSFIDWDENTGFKIFFLVLIKHQVQIQLSLLIKKEKTLVVNLVVCHVMIIDTQKLLLLVMTFFICSKPQVSKQ